MPATIQEIYSRIVRILTPTDRLRLATLLLNDLVQHTDVVDQSDTWTEQDQLDLVDFSLQHVALGYLDSEAIDE